METEIDEDDVKKIDKSHMQMIMENSIMQSVVIQGGNENFEEDEDELDIFAESNKKEPMRNPIIGGGNQNNFSIMDQSVT